MPEIRFQIQWPDGTEEICYSPSLVVRQYLESGTEYEVEDFLQRSRTALQEASRRVKAKFGFECSLALGQLQRLEIASARYTDNAEGTLSYPHARVKLLKFIES